MRPVEIGRLSSNSVDFTSRRRDEAASEKPAESRALVPIAPPVLPHEAAQNYRYAPFLAQLIAAKQQVPQSRERRRAEPAEAMAAYRAMATLS